MAKIAELLQAILNGESINFTPKTNTQKYLKACCDKCGCSGLPTPKTIQGALLYQLAEKMATSKEAQAITITENGTYNAPEGKAYTPVTVNVDSEPTLQDKTITENGTYSADSGYDGLDEVTVNVPNPSSGSISISANGTYDVTEKASAVVNVPQPSGNINITTTAQTDVTNYATAQVVDADLVAGNIKKDVDILGVVGTLEVPTEPYREETFDNSHNLTNVALHGYTFIGNHEFHNCGSLALTSLPSSITYIGTYAFYYCTSLALTSLPSSLESIQMHSFEGCASLALTSLPSSIRTVYRDGFNACTSLALTSLPSSLEELGQSSFDGCTSLALTSLPSSLEMVGSYAFRDCTGLISITFEGTPRSIVSTAFKNCTNLTDIKVPWAEGAVANAPWGATNATITYNYTA